MGVPGNDGGRRRRRSGQWDHARRDDQGREQGSLWRLVHCIIATDFGLQPEHSRAARTRLGHYHQQGSHPDQPGVGGASRIAGARGHWIEQRDRGLDQAPRRQPHRGLYRQHSGRQPHVGGRSRRWDEVGALQRHKRVAGLGSQPWGPPWRRSHHKHQVHGWEAGLLGDYWGKRPTHYFLSTCPLCVPFLRCPVKICRSWTYSRDWVELRARLSPSILTHSHIFNTHTRTRHWQCNMHPGAGIGTGYGCKGLPKQPCSVSECGCNGAWVTNPNGSITSLMSGLCLAAAGSRVTDAVCAGNDPSQQWKIVPSPRSPTAVHIVQGSNCVDDNQPPPPPPTPPGPSGPSDVSINLQSLGLNFSGAVRVRDVWAHKDLPGLASTDATLSTHVPYHGSVFLVLMPADSEWPLPFELAPWMRSEPTPGTHASRP
eukprot:m.207172 g.207172  ORF g.207172 m.207172 type:complete len:428 (+) comp15442_c1_seq9:1282-2565(+)